MAAAEEKTPLRHERVEIARGRLDAWLTRAETAAESDPSGRYPAELSALIAIGHGLRMIHDAICWVGGDR